MSKDAELPAGAQTAQPYAAETSGKELPGLRGEAPHLSRRALEMARSLASFTRGQLAFYAQRKGRIDDVDVDAIVSGDTVARKEYCDLVEHEKARDRNGNQLVLGTAILGVELQAYQPRVNRRVVRKPSDLQGAYSLTRSTIIGNEFIDRVNEFVRQTPTPNEKGGAMTYLGEFVRNTLIQTIVMGEMLSERGVGSPMTLTLPETTSRLVRQFYPDVFARIQKAQETGALDVGLSNAHHSIAPLLSKDDLEREYSHSLRYYLKNFKPKDGRVTVHIPEQAKTEDLLEVLTKVQRDHGVELVVCFDSLHHNPGYDISRATRFEFSNPPKEFTAFFRAFHACDRMAWHVVNKGDPLTREERERRDLTGLTPSREEGWADEEAGRLFSIFVTDIFGTEVDPDDRREGRHDTWRKPLYEGRDSAIILANDAEFIGLHHPGEGLAFMRFLEALGEFGVEVASFQKTLRLVGAVRETEKHPYDASWSGDFGLWINPRTQWLRDAVGETLTAYKRPLQYATDALSGHNPGMSDEKLPRELKASWENYGLSLLSCPYWWSGWEPDYPNSVPVVPELFRNMASLGKDLDTMLTKMMDRPGDYNLPEGDVDAVRSMRTQLREADGRFRENPAARRYEPIKLILDGYRRF